MASDDGPPVGPDASAPGRGGSLWGGFTRGVWLVLGCTALCVACISALVLLAAIERKAWAAMRPFGGLMLLALMSTHFAFKRASRPRPSFAGTRGAGRDNGLSRFLPVARGLEVTEDEIEALAATTGHPLRFLASQLTTLSPELARKIISQSQPFGLDLSGLRSLTKESAEIVAESDGPITLDGLRTISSEVAEALSHHRGWLRLDGLTDLTPTAADHLARHGHAVHLGEFYNCLSLDGLATLSEETASALARFPGNLRLNGLETLKPEVARILATHVADENWGVAELYSLLLDGLRSLSDESAGALACYGGGLSLDGLERPSDEALRALAHHRGNALSFGRLVAMPDDVAVRFGLRTTRLFVPRLREVSPEGMAALRRNPNVILSPGHNVDPA